MLILHLLGATVPNALSTFFGILTGPINRFRFRFPLDLVAKLMVGYLSGSYLFLSADPFRHLILSFWDSFFIF